MKVRLYLIISPTNDNQSDDPQTSLAAQLRSHVDRISTAETFIHEGVRYKIDPQGIYVEIDHRIDRLPEAYQGMVGQIIVTAELTGDEWQPGPSRYQWGQTCAIVEHHIGVNGREITLTVTGPALWRVNKLHDLIRTDRANEYRVIEYGVQSSTRPGTVAASTSTITDPTQQ